MTYFSDHYSQVKFPIETSSSKGLRNAQIGAIHAIASHFTIHDKEPAIVVMPTGAGKTAVLYLSAFVLRASRVLVITPSRLVRNQIFEGFRNLNVLIDANSLPKEIAKPKVEEVTEVLDQQDKWDALQNFDVIVATPHSLPVNSWAVNPSPNLFDLVLIDEAHHSSAHTWNSILKHFEEAKKVLFTATPFRRDKKEIKGSFIFNYPISRAYDDKIFGTVDFIAVNPDPRYTNDINLAKKAEKVFNSDKEKKLEHYLLVRTDTKAHSKELLKTYSENTKLRLKRIDSTLSSKHISKIITDLQKNELDGVICVDMLGEGFDFPNLKIGVIHHPHKSLAITLQFIGRFARTNAANIGSAKFLAIPNEINFLKLELYQEGAVWKDIIREISETTIQNEIEVRQALQQFVSQEVEFEDDRDISLYSLKPFHHVKIFEVNKSFDISRQVVIPDNNIDKHFVSTELSVAVYITKEVQKPKWLATDELINVNFNLFIIFYDTDNQLLYINSTKKTINLYRQIANQYLDEVPKQLPLDLVHKVIADLENPEVFNLGLRSKNTMNNAESYLIKAGSHVQNSIKANEINLYEGGHLFLRGKENGQFNTIGYSSSSKVWSNTTAKITDFIKWCLALSIKINSTKTVKTNTELDRITFRKVIDTIPLNPIFASWDAECYRQSFHYYYDRQGQIHDGLLADLDIQLDLNKCNSNKICFTISNEDFSEPYKFTIADFYEYNSNNFLSLFVVTDDGEQIEMSQFLNDYPITFYFQDFASIRLNELSSRTLTDNMSFNLIKIEVINWQDTDIDCEYSGNQPGKLHIHDKIKSLLLAKSPNVLLYDHGSGEMADFISIKENTGSILVELYHCKGAGAKTTGNRVEDVYELCGQAIKSGIWTNSAVLKDKISKRLNRKNPSKFLIGDNSELNRLLGLNKIFQFRIVAVQPGLLKTNIGVNISEILAAAESYIENGDAVRFNLITS